MARRRKTNAKAPPDKPEAEAESKPVVGEPSQDAVRAGADTASVEGRADQPAEISQPGAPRESGDDPQLAGDRHELTGGEGNGQEARQGPGAGGGAGAPGSGADGEQGAAPEDPAAQAGQAAEGQGDGEARRFRKKPVVIEAVQVGAADFNPALFGTEHNPWDGAPFSETPPWLIEAVESGVIAVYPDDRDYARWRIGTLEDGPNGEAKHIADPGDWIIRGVKGELYPCKPDIFEASYEPLPTEEEAQNVGLPERPEWDSNVLAGTFAASHAYDPRSGGAFAGFDVDDDAADEHSIHEVMTEAASFVRTWPDVSAEAIVIHLRRAGFRFVPEAGRREKAAWAVFKATIAELDAVDKAEAAEREAEQRAKDRAVKAVPREDLAMMPEDPDPRTDMARQVPPNAPSRGASRQGQE